MQVTNAIRLEKGYLIDGVLSLAVFVVTALTVFPLFSGDFTQNWGSGEAIFMADAVFIVNNWPHIGWNPYWYSGVSFRSMYTPLLPYAVALLHGLVTNWSIGHAYRVLTGLAYSGVPASLYLFTRHLAKSRAAGLVAGLTYSLFPTFDPAIATHVEVLTPYGEGPHTLGLLFALLAVLQLFRCFRQPTRIRYVTFAGLATLVALTDLVALFGFALIALVALGTEMMYGRLLPALRVFFLSTLITLGFVGFQYSWEFVSGPVNYARGEFSGQVLQIHPVILLFLSIAIIVVLSIARSYLREIKGTKPFFLALVWILAFAVIVLAKQWFNLTVAPQTTRYVLELDLGISLLIGLLVGMGIDHLPNFLPNRIMRSSLRASMIAVVLVIMLLVAQLILLPTSLRVTAPSTSIADVPEYRLANWLSAHAIDERVYATGTPAFWLNVFSNVSQVRGGSDQGATNKWWAHVTYQINNHPDAELSILWAKALNAKYIIVIFPNATTAFHDYVYPEKFKNTLPLRYYYNGFGIYETPLSQASLVQGVSAEATRQLRPISSVLDKQGLSEYLRVVESPPPGTEVSYYRNNPDQLVIAVSNASRDTAIIVKMTFDPRWKAQVNNRLVPISELGPGFMVVYPEMTGRYQLTLRFDFSPTEVLGYFITAVTLVVILTIEPARSLYRSRQRTEQIQE